MIGTKHIQALSALLGPKGVISEPSELAPHLREWRDKYIGDAPLMLSPATAEETAEIVRYCNEHGVEIVPQGGNTGLVGGGIPGLEGREQILLSTRRMTSVVEVDPDNYSLIAEAGCTVSALQDAATHVDRMFALSLASEGSCTAGGVAATNAGGMHVIRYGTTRAQILGLEAVLADGSIINELSPLRKDNTGYALSQLLIGAEGTLGIITKVSFRLFPLEKERATAWIGVPTPQAALKLLSLARELTGDQISVFELMARPTVEMALEHIPGTSDPLREIHPWYILLEIASPQASALMQDQLQSLLEAAMEAEYVKDAALAQSEAQRTAFWHMRESLSEAQKHEGGSIKHDISVPVSCIPDFITAATEKLEMQFPGARITPFGHMGDGNLHFNVMQPKGTDKQVFLNQWEAMNTLVHDIVIEFDGSISAEHGIGRMKKAELSRTKPRAHLDAARAIKLALDPNNIMNPGALFE